MPRWLRDNALTVAMLGAFLVFLLLQSVFGWQVHNEELTEYGAPAELVLAYLGTGHFAEAVFENWESEFLQMGGYVLLTAYLVQKGSAESKPEGQTDRPEDDPRPRQAGLAVAGPGRRAAAGGLPQQPAIALLLIFAGVVPRAPVRRRRPRTTRSRRCRAAPPRSAPGSSSAPATSGSSRCRTGRASSSRSAR